MISVMKVATMAKARKDSIAASALRRAGRGREIEGGQHDIARAAAEARVDKVGNGVEQALAAHGGERANIGIAGVKRAGAGRVQRSEEHTSELQSLMRISYAVFCLKKKKNRSTSKSEEHTYEHQELNWLQYAVHCLNT